MTIGEINREGKLKPKWLHLSNLDAYSVYGNGTHYTCQNCFRVLVGWDEGLIDPCYFGSIDADIICPDCNFSGNVAHVMPEEGKLMLRIETKDRPEFVYKEIPDKFFHKNPTLRIKKRKKWIVF